MLMPDLEELGLLSQFASGKEEATHTLFNNKSQNLSPFWNGTSLPSPTLYTLIKPPFSYSSRLVSFEYRDVSSNLFLLHVLSLADKINHSYNLHGIESKLLNEQSCNSWRHRWSA